MVEEPCGERPRYHVEALREGTARTDNESSGKYRRLARRWMGNGLQY